MEKNANYALVGLSSLILFIGLVIFVVWLARISFSQEYDLYDIVFDGPVRGLNQGGEVHFNGIKVGEVTKIALDRTNPSRVIARARVTSDVPIRVDSYATLEPQGITGVNYVQITAGTPSKPLLKVVEKAKCERAGISPCIPILKTQRSALADLLEGGGTVLTRTIEALDRVNRVLSEQNIKNFSATLSDAQAFHRHPARAQAAHQRRAEADPGPRLRHPARRRDHHFGQGDSLTATASAAPRTSPTPPRRPRRRPMTRAA